MFLTFISTIGIGVQKTIRPMLNFRGGLLCVLVLLGKLANGFNVAPEALYIRSVDSGMKHRHSYFGYSVGLLKTKSSVWLLAGAPRANSSVPGVVEPGTLFKCDLSSQRIPCEEIILDESINFAKNGKLGAAPLRNNAWTGAALDIDRHGNVIIGSPRWSDAINRHLQEYNTNGICYLLGPDLSSNTAEILPVLLSSNRQLYNYYGKGVYYYQHGQVGMAVHVTNSDKQQLLLGAPGLLNWQGSVALLEEMPAIPPGGRNKRQATFLYDTRVIPNPIYTDKIQDGNYFGYSITSGKFDYVKKNHYVAGAPRGGNAYGTVLVFLMRTIESQSLDIKEERRGLQLGEYFGASVAAPDLNGDGLSDLVVGAPLHSHLGIGDAGCVYVYMNNHIKKGKLAVDGIKIIGDPMKGARYGTALGTPGDLNKDGFEDLLVGAPYENADEGAVYVYMGYQNGIREEYAQKLSPKSVQRQYPLKGFGISFSRPVDIDNNRYPDFAIGSFKSDAAVVMATLPVITIKGKISSNPSKLSLAHSYFTATPCVSYSGFGAPQSTDISVTVTLSQEPGDGTIPATFRENGNPDIQIILKASAGESLTCQELAVDLTGDRTNAQMPIIIRMKYDLRSSGSKGLVIDPHADLPEPVTVSFITGCRNEVCHADLVTSARLKEFPNGESLLIGEKNKVTLEVEIANRKDPAFLPNVTLSFPSSLIMLPSLHECSKLQGNDRRSIVSCHLKSPLLTNKMEKLTLEFDVSLLDDSSTDIRFDIHANSAADFDDNPTNNNFTTHLNIKKKASVEFRGSSNPEQYSYHKFDDYSIESNSTVKIEHIITISKLETTPVGSIVLSASFPSEINVLGQQLIILKELEHKLSFHRKTYHCEVKGNQLRELSSGMSASDLPSNQGYLPSSDKFYTISCSSKLFNCQTIVCEIGPWGKSFDVATLTVSFELDLVELVSRLSTPCHKQQPVNVDYGHYDESRVIHVRDGAMIESEIFAEITSFKGPEKEFEGERKTKGVVQTQLIAGTLPPEPLAWWIYFLAIIGGLLLLSLIAYGLFKLGFFKRKRKMALESQKATLVHQEESQPNL